MSGNVIGGAKARDTNYVKHGRDFYKKIGAMGGKVSKTGGFYANRELASTAGRIGGSKSKRGSTKFKGLPSTYVEPAWKAKKWWQRIIRRKVNG